MFNQKLRHYIFVIKFLSIMVVILKLYSLIRGNENQKTKLYFFENSSLQSFFINSIKIIHSGFGIFIGRLY